MSNAAADESAGAIAFAVSLDAPAAEDVVLRYAAEPGTATAGKDYLSPVGKVTIPAGETTGVITLGVKDDGRYERTETFRLNLTAKGATLADGSAKGTITDDDAAPMIAVKDVSVREGNDGVRLARVTISLSEPAGSALVVKYKTEDETPYYQAATAGSDYLATGGKIVFEPGETRQVVTVAIKGDVVKEGNEVLRVSASYSDGSGGAAGVVIIKDDDVAQKKGEPILRVSDGLAMEGAAGETSQAGITVTLSRVSGRDVTFLYSYGQAVTEKGLSVAPTFGVSYSPGSGKITIPAGQKSATIPIAVTGNHYYQPNQVVAVRVTKISGARAINGEKSVGATLNIVDDEPVFLLDHAGTLVYGFSGLTRSTDYYVGMHTLQNINVPVFETPATLVSGGTLHLGGASLVTTQVLSIAPNVYAVSPDAFVATQAASWSAGSVTSTFAGEANLSGALDVNDYALIYGGRLSSSLRISTITAVSGLVSTGSGTLTLDGVNISSGAGATGVLSDAVDVGAGSRFIEKSADAVRSLLKTGFAGGTWAGAGGIYSSAAANDGEHRTAVGYVELVNGFVLVGHTYYGDANLDGVVDHIDAAIVRKSLADGAPASWSAGDFNYDDVINADDLAILDRNFSPRYTLLAQ